MTLNTSRRHFLKGSAAVALIVGFGAGGLLEARANSAAEKSFNPFVKIRSDNKIIAVVKHFEMGQGTSTGLTTILAEELDADWDDMIVEFARQTGKTTPIFSGADRKEPADHPLSPTVSRNIARPARRRGIC